MRNRKETHRDRVGFVACILRNSPLWHKHLSPGIERTNGANKRTWIRAKPISEHTFTRCEMSNLISILCKLKASHTCDRISLLLRMDRVSSARTFICDNETNSIESESVQKKTYEKKTVPRVPYGYTDHLPRASRFKGLGIASEFFFQKVAQRQQGPPNGERKRRISYFTSTGQRPYNGHQTGNARNICTHTLWASSWLLLTGSNDVTSECQIWALPTICWVSFWTMQRML